MAFLRHQSPKHWISPTEILQLPPTHFSKSDNGLWPIQSSFYGGILGFFWQGYYRVPHLRTKGSFSWSPTWGYPTRSSLSGFESSFSQPALPPCSHDAEWGKKGPALPHCGIWSSSVDFCCFCKAKASEFGVYSTLYKAVWSLKVCLIWTHPPEASASAAVHCHSLGNISPSNPQGLAKFRKCRCMWTKTRNSSKVSVFWNFCTLQTCSKNLTNNPQLWHTHSFILLLVCSLCLVLWECCEFPHLWEGVQLKGNKMVFLCWFFLQRLTKQFSW